MWIQKDAQDDSYAEGGNTKWTEVEFSMDFDFKSFTKQAGIRFRVQDNDNYYQIAFSEDRVILSAVHNGIYSELANQPLSGPILRDNLYNLGVKLEGPKIQVLVDGRR